MSGQLVKARVVKYVEARVVKYVDQYANLLPQILEKKSQKLSAPASRRV
jgi:hypothetical protein